MTQQIRNKLSIGRQEYFILAATNTEQLSFRNFCLKIRPSMLSTANYAGYHCTFAVIGEYLYLKNLTVHTDSRVYPPLNGVIPNIDKYSQAVYEGVNIALSYTGELLIAADYIRELGQYQIRDESIKYRYVAKTKFFEGKKISFKNISEKLDKERNADKDILELMSKPFISLAEYFDNWINEELWKTTKAQAQDHQVQSHRSIFLNLWRQE